MNRFNDIVQEDKVLEIPQYINDIEDYGDIIKNAFDLTDGLLSLDDRTIEEDDRHIRVTITSKNIETRFRLNRLENNRIDQNNLIRGLNKALTDIFYLGEERFYSLNGIVLPSAIGFISNREKRHLMKAGLIGKTKEVFNVEKTDRKISEPVVKKEEKPQTRSDRQETQKDKTQESGEPFVIQKKYNFIEDKLRRENSLVLFKIIHQPEKHSREIVETAKKIALSKDIPIFSRRKYAETASRYRGIIDKIAKISSKNDSSGSIHRIFDKNNISREDRFLILAEVQKSIKEDDKTPLWKIILRIIIFIIALLMFLARL